MVIYYIIELLLEVDFYCHVFEPGQILYSIYIIKYYSIIYPFSLYSQSTQIGQMHNSFNLLAKIIFMETFHNGIRVKYPLPLFAFNIVYLILNNFEINHFLNLME